MKGKHMNIKKSPSGKVIKTLKGYKAFIPNPLPPKVEWDAHVWRNLSKADHLLGKLSREGAKLPNPHLLIRPFITREAVFSSKIEGTQATLGEILASEAGAQVARSQNDLQEVQNYITALDYGVNRLQEIPVSLRLIKEMHKILLQGVRGAHATPGDFRRTQNWIGLPGSTLSTAKYVPPSPEDMMNCLGDFELFLYDDTLPPLINVALCHYQFEAIHPFLDGNGRIGRLLIILLLIEKKMLPSPLLYLSAYFEATRDEYYRQLYNISMKGTWNEWLSYFLHGVAVQSQDVLSRAERINELIIRWQIEFGRSKSIKNIINHFTVNPYLTTSKIAKNLDIAFSTALRSIRKLEKYGIVSEVSRGPQGRVYCATEILAILEEPTKINKHFEQPERID